MPDTIISQVMYIAGSVAANLADMVVHCKPCIRLYSPGRTVDVPFVFRIAFLELPFGRHTITSASLRQANAVRLAFVNDMFHLKPPDSLQ